MLAQSPCRRLCSWGLTDAELAGLPLFRCAGCGTEWVRTEPWSPRQADGSWPPGVREELAVRDAGGAAAAGTPGTSTPSGS